MVEQDRPAPRPAPQERHGLGPTRARVLAHLQDAGVPMTASTAGSRLGLHANTARFHLDALVRAGLVHREQEQRVTRGRPQVMYAAATDAPGVQHRSYRLLAGVLSALVTAALPDPEAAAEEAGRAWGRSLTGPAEPAAEPAPEPAPETAQGLATLVETMDRVGFDSHVVDQPDSLRLEVSHCPFLEVAEDHHDVVCSVHRGLIRGVLEQSGTPVSVESLEPLVEPSLCIAHLAR